MGDRSRISGIGLLGRQFRADLGPLLAMAAVVLIASVFATVAPLSLGSISAAEVEYQVDSLPTVRRVVVSHLEPSVSVTPGHDVFLGFEKNMIEIADTTPFPLNATLGEPVIVVTSSVFDTGRNGEKPGTVPNDPLSPLAPITLNAAPHLTDHIRIVAGDLPRPFLAVPDSDDDAIDILLSVDSASRAEWTLGETRRLGSGVLVRLSGIFEATDPGEDYWGVATNILEPVISYFGFGGPPNPIVTSAAFVDADSWSSVVDAYASGMSTTVGYPFMTSGLTIGDIAELQPQLRGFQSVAHLMDKRFWANMYVPTVTFRTDAGLALHTGLERSATTTAVLAMVASGPIGVALAGLWLLARLIVFRRRDALALAAARGASEWQLRLTIGVESLLLSLPVAVLGAGIGYLVVPASGNLAPLLFAGVVGLIPPALLALAATPRTIRGGRGDLNTRARWPYRWVLELAVLGVTVLAMYLLLQRGLATSAASVGIDPLLAATPLLLAVSAGLVILRLYPLPLLAVARATKARRGIVAFLGAHRSIREPAAGLAPVLAMIVGLAVAVFSAVLVGTLTSGVAATARSSVGADLRIDSQILNEEQLAAIDDVDGVEEAVSLYQYNRLLNLSVGTNLSVPVIVTDTAALARVQAGVPGTARFDLNAATTVEGRMPVLLSPDIAAQYSIRDDSTLGEAGIVSAGDPGISPSLSGVQFWALIDTANSGELGIEKFLPRITLVKLAPGADAAQVASSLAAIAGSGAVVTSPADAAQALLNSPASIGLQVSLVALLAITALLCATAVLLALLIGSPARRRLLAVLRMLGLRLGQARGIAAWEIGPSTAIALVAGCVLGAVLPVIVLAGVDLRPFTGGPLQPAVTIGPGLLGLLLGGFAALVIAATAVAIAAARRADPARTLRTFEEG